MSHAVRLRQTQSGLASLPDRDVQSGSWGPLATSQATPKWVFPDVLRAWISRGPRLTVPIALNYVSVVRRADPIPIEMSGRTVSPPERKHPVVEMKGT